MDSTVPQSSSSIGSSGVSAFAETLRNANYTKLLIGQVLAALGDRINQIALLYLVVEKFKNTSKFSADIMFWAVLPSIALSPFTLAWADRWNRQQAMIVCDLARAILVASLPILMGWSSHHYVVYTIVFLVGIFTAIFTPCRLAILPNLVPPKLLPAANSLSSQAGTLASVVGMPLGAWLVEHFGVNNNFFINAITYLISAALIWRLRIIPTTGEPIKETGFRHPIEEMRAGLVYTLRTFPVLVYVIFFSLVQFLVATFFVCFVSYVPEVLKLKVQGTVILFFILSAGIGAGALTLGRLLQRKDHYHLPMIMTSIAGVGLFLLSQIQNPYLAGGVLFGIGFCIVPILVPLDTFLQKNVPDDLRGRVFTVRGVLWGAFFLVSLQLSKGVIYQMGTIGALQILGIAALVIGLIGGWLGQRAWSSTKPPDPEICDTN